MAGVSGKVVLVTGAGRGIGRATALAFARLGCRMALGFRDLEDDHGATEEIASLGVEVLPLQLDVRRKDQIDAAVSATVVRFGQIDILVNNAGGGRIALAVDVTEEDFDAIVSANLKGTFFMSQAVGRIMIAQGGGKIVNVGSQAGAVALPTESIYCAAKAGVAHLTKCLAAEWGSHHINVNCVAPTFIRTPGTEPALSDPTFKKHVLDMIALGRVGEVEDVTGVIVFLCSESAAMITGATVLIDGGWTLK